MENRYISEISSLLRIKKMSCKESRVDFDFPVTKESLTRLFAQTFRHMTRPDATYFQSYLDSKNIRDGEDRSDVVTNICASTSIIVLSEILALFNGAIIHIEDTDLVEALLRTDIDANIGDVKLPFPIMEFAYPGGIRATDRYQVSGTLVVDMRTIDYQKEFESVEFIKTSDQAGRVPADIAIITRFCHLDGKLEMGNNVIKVMASDPLATIESPPDMPAEEREGLAVHARLVMAILLYLQSVERQKALQPVERRGDCFGMPAVMHKVDKKRPNYRVIDIATKAVHMASVPGGGHHSSPETHWRKGHIRALRDERYKRNLDGSVKTVWIRPSKINAEKDDMAVAERKLAMSGQI